VSFWTRCAPRTLARESSPQVVSHLRRICCDLHLESPRHSLDHHHDHHHHDNGGALDHDDDLDHPTRERRVRGQNFSGLYNTGEGAAGTVYATVTLTNTGTTSCTLHGWPILTLQDKLGAVLTSALVDVPSAGNSFQFLAGSATGLTSKANDAPTTLTLAKNATATFALAYSDVPVGTAACENAISVFVQFAKNGTPVSLTPSEPVQPCSNGEIWLSPFY